MIPDKTITDDEIENDAETRVNDETLEETEVKD